MSNDPRLSQLDQSGATDGQVPTWDETLGEWVPATIAASDAIPKAIVDAKGDLIAGTSADTPVRVAVGADGKVLKADSAAAAGMSWQDDLALLMFPYSYTGNVTTVTGTFRLYAERAMTITAVRASVGTAPTGSSLIVDVNKNGTTIFTTQSNRPTITAGTNTATAAAINVASMAIGDYLTIDIDQVGSTTPGANLTVTVTATAS